MISEQVPDSFHGPADSRDSSVTVVIPTHDRRELLLETLATVYAQEPRPHSVVIVDDGSTDGTAEVLENEPVTVVRNPEGGWGPARARHEALAYVDSEFVAFLDSDDLLLPGALAELEHALQAEPSAPFAFGRALTASKNGSGWTPTGLMTAAREELRDPLPSLYARNFVPSVGSMARTESVREIGGYPQRTDFAQDHYFWVRLAQLGNPVFVPAITSVYREHVGNRHTPVRAGAELDAYLDLAEADPRLAEAVPEHLGVAFCNTFTYSVRVGERGQALAILYRNLVTHSERYRIVRRAVQHWRNRRRWSSAGERALAGDAELREWLDRR
jgi:glycosyltransferase involved in cell wall biosynthesis